jgi:hypothetical protein
MARVTSTDDAIATSSDGRTFSVPASPTMHLALGDLVVLDPDDGTEPLVGQVIEQEPPTRGVHGGGAGRRR